MAHFYQTTRRHTPEDGSIHSRYCPNFQYDVFRENWFSATLREMRELKMRRGWTEIGRLLEVLYFAD